MAAGLPDGRGYELVSPPSKNGADIIPQTNKTHAAVDGNGVGYTALGAFGDAQGTSLDVQYLARRTGVRGTNGWSTRAINPAGGGAPTLNALLLDNLPTFEAAFPPDLSSAIYCSWRPLTNAPNVADVSNLYRLGHLDARARQVVYMREGGSRTYQLNASEKTSPESPGDAQVWGMSSRRLARVLHDTGGTDRR